MRAAGTGNSGISFGGSRGDSSVGNNSNGPKSTGANKMPVSNTAPNANSLNQSPNPNGLNTSGVQPTEGIHMPNSGLGSGLGGPSKGRSNIGNLLKSGRNLGSTSVPNDSAVCKHHENSILLNEMQFIWSIVNMNNIISAWKKQCGHAKDWGWKSVYLQATWKQRLSNSSAGFVWKTFESIGCTKY